MKEYGNIHKENEMRKKIKRIEKKIKFSEIGENAQFLILYLITLFFGGGGGERFLYVKSVFLFS